MQISGDDAARYKAVRLDSYADVNKGVLIFADEQTGAVSWKDSVGQVVSRAPIAHAIKITPAR